MKIKLFIFTFLSLWGSLALAADLKGLTDLLERSFRTNMYQKNYCSKNIENFARAAQNDGINLDNAYIVKIENAGMDSGGFVNAVSARDVGQVNWEYHVVLIADGSVFDFDFMNKATVLELEEYLDQQFIPANKRNYKPFKKDKIGPYRLQIFPANIYLDYLERKISVKDIKKEVFLRDFFPKYFNY